MTEKRNKWLELLVGFLVCCAFIGACEIFDSIYSAAHPITITHTYTPPPPDTAKHLVERGVWTQAQYEYAIDDHKAILRDKTCSEGLDYSFANAGRMCVPYSYP